MGFPAGSLFIDKGEREIPERDTQMLDGEEKRVMGTCRAENRL
jgi:hypothetical protein